MNLAATAATAVFGLVAGSFMTVCVHRLPRGLSVVHPGSRCPECGHALAAWENLPALGYVLLRGRCHACREAIGMRYLAIELACAAAFAWSWRRSGGGGAAFVQGAFFLACLVGLTATDAATRQLPDEITLGGWAAGLGLALLTATPGIGSALLASFGGAGLLAAVGLGYQRWRGRPGLGWGDVKVVGMLGAFLGVESLLVAVLLAAVSGSLVGLAQALGVLRQRRRRGQNWRRARASTAIFMARSALPFGVFLAAASAVAWAWGPQLWLWWVG